MAYLRAFVLSTVRRTSGLGSLKRIVCIDSVHIDTGGRRIRAGLRHPGQVHDGNGTREEQGCIVVLSQVNIRSAQSDDSNNSRVLIIE